MIDSFTKDPAATLDYGLDWSDWLAAGETIAASEWSVPAGLTKDSDDHNTTLAAVWLSGGTAGATYRITNRVTTSAGRIDERSLFIVVEER